MCFSRQNVSFRRSLNVLNCFKSDSNIGYSGLSGCGFSLQNYLILLCRRNGLYFENLAQKFCFSLEIGFFCLRGKILSFFRPTWGNIYLFLVVYLEMNRSVYILKRVHTNNEPTGTSSSWFATSLNEVSVSLQLLFVYAYFPLPLDFSVPYVSLNPAVNQLYKILIWLKVIGLFVCQGGSKDVFFSPKRFFKKVFECFKLLQI